MSDMIKKIKVLNSGYVELIDYMGNEKRICEATRISTNSTGSPEKDKKLISYLIRHQHTSPLEHVEFVFKVKAPLFVLRQWMRHRTWSYNEVSGRYVELNSDDFYVPDEAQVNKRSKSIKQGRGKLVRDETENKLVRRIIDNSCKKSSECYKLLVKDDEGNIARELARVVLPLSQYTEMYCKVDLNNLLRFLYLRLKKNAQYEIRVYAEAILNLVKPLVPNVIAAWEEHILHAVNISKSDRENLKNLLTTLNSSELEGTNKEFIRKLLKKIK